MADSLIAFWDLKSSCTIYFIVWLINTSRKFLKMLPLYFRIKSRGSVITSVKVHIEEEMTIIVYIILGCE